MKPSCFRLYNYAVENLHADKLLKEQRGKSGGNPIKWTVREEGGGGSAAQMAYLF